MQCVLTPAERFMPMTNEEICAEVDAEVRPYRLTTACLADCFIKSVTYPHALTLLRTFRFMLPSLSHSLIHYRQNEHADPVIGLFMP